MSHNISTTKATRRPLLAQCADGLRPSRYECGMEGRHRHANQKAKSLANMGVPSLLASISSTNTRMVTHATNPQGTRLFACQPLRAPPWIWTSPSALASRWQGHSQNHKNHPLTIPMNVQKDHMRHRRQSMTCPNYGRLHRIRPRLLLHHVPRRGLGWGNTRRHQQQTNHR